MSQADGQAPPPKPVTPQPFRSRYKLRGMIAAMVLLWLAFAYIYHALMTNDAGALSAGMVGMLGGAGVAYYFS